MTVDAAAGARAAYRGYRLQALYILWRLLTDADSPQRLYHLEGREDLDVIQADGTTELIQVKAHSEALTVSALTPFLTRALAVAKADMQRQTSLVLVSYGPVGPELLRALEAPGEARVAAASKLSEKLDATASEAEELLSRLDLRTVDEPGLRADVSKALGDSFLGVDPESGFDLVTYWLYTLAEQSQHVDKSQLVERMLKAGRFLAERAAHYREWHTTILPITDYVVPSDHEASAEREYFQGVSARYEHILLGLDVARPRALETIAEAFESKSVVLLHAASGEGKTTLALRYLHDYYPEDWRFAVTVVDGRAHAASVATALEGQAKALDAPLLVYVDVSPRDVGWADLVSRLAAVTNIKVLVTVREEDWRRTTSATQLTGVASLSLELTEDEAREVYDALTKSGRNSRFVSFREAWTQFHSRGPMMEFIHLITQGTSLRERLQLQVSRLEDDVREGRLQTCEVEFLRMVAVVSSLGARLRLPVAAQRAGLTVPKRTVELFEREYLLRVDGDSVDGLHPLRSEILAQLLTDEALEPLSALLVSSLDVIAPGDLGTYLLHVFSRHPCAAATVTQRLRDDLQLSWPDTVGVVRALLWLGLHNYRLENEALIRSVHAVKGDAWTVLLDVDVALIHPISRSFFEELPDEMFSAESKEQLRDWRRQQTDREHVYQELRVWAQSRSTPPSAPVSAEEWSAIAEACFWARRVGARWPVVEWLGTENIIAAAQREGLDQMCELYGSLVGADHESAGLDDARHALINRLKSEAHTVLVEDAHDRVAAHFIVPLEQLESAAGGADGANRPHAEALRRCRMLAQLYPDRSTLITHGYGHLLVDGQPDDTHKEIDRENLFPRWLPELNSTFIGLGSHLFRPADWREYCRIVDGLRSRVIRASDALSSGMVKYFRSTDVDLLVGKVVSKDIFDLQRYEAPLLPAVAVDEWGYVHESQANSSRESQMGGAELCTTSSPWAVAMAEYDVFRKPLSGYVTSFRNFLDQIAPLLVVEPYLRAPSNSLDRGAVAEALGVDVRGPLISLNLANAIAELPRLQAAAGPLMTRFLGGRRGLERREGRSLAAAWAMLQQMDLNPRRLMSAPLKTASEEVLSLAQTLRGELLEVATQQTGDSASLRPLGSEVAEWWTPSELWLTLDSEDPVRTYESLAGVVGAVVDWVSRTIGLEGEADESRARVWRLNCAGVRIVPTVCGGMLHDHCWLVDGATGVLSVEAAPPELSDKLTTLSLDSPVAENVRQMWLQTAETYWLAMHLADLGRLPDLEGDSLRQEQEYVNAATGRLSATLQRAIDEGTLVISWLAALGEGDLLMRPRLVQAIAALREWLTLVHPSEATETSLTMSEFRPWAANLNTASELAFSVLLGIASDELTQRGAYQDARVAGTRLPIPPDAASTRRRGLQE